MAELVPPYIAALQPYVTGMSIEEARARYGLERVVKLASNENPLGASPLAVAAMQAALSGSYRYPDGGLALRKKLAERFGVKLANVIAGAGSEGLMADIMRTFLCDDDEVLTSEGTFMGMRVLAQSRGVAYRTVPLREASYDLPAMAAAITEKTKLIYLANPNNPTGTIFSSAEFDAFYARVPARVLIILDEAYFEYAQDNPRYPDSMHYRYDNVITLRTFSKAYGLASVRIGYGFAHEDLIAMLLKVKLPFEPSGLASAAGLAALDDHEFLQRTLETNARGLRQMTVALSDLGLRPVPSEANFIMVRLASPERAAALAEQLLRAGVIVRPLGPFGLPACLRITIGTTEENELCLSALQQILSLEPVATSCR
jgi:histidinol-phosphate aminotransferase